MVPVLALSPMIADQRKFLTTLAASFFADRPRQSVSEWCRENLRFNEPNNSGPFTLAGREYIREPLDAWSDPTISDQVDCFGSQSGKTAKTMGGAAWTIENNPSRIFWVMPTRDTVTSFAKSRWIPMLRASAAMAAGIPVGTQRHKFTTREQHIKGSIVSLAWSNSPASLAGVPAPVVILDEVDKFNEGTKAEADAVNLAEQRTKNFATPKRIKSSTPTLVTGLIWQEFLKTDQRRRFVPCPLCGKLVVLAWSKNYTVFKLTGAEAFIYWDKEARREDGSWDLDRVERSAHALCPHCAGHIRNDHKTRMDRDGCWQPTAQAARGYRGWHLPSLYASSPETSFGRLAVKFLQAKKSLLGVQGFINGDLAEPYQAQDTLGERIELITSRLDVIAEWKKLMAVDCQQKAPYFWRVVRAWNGGDSHGLDAASCSTWEELRETQTKHGIRDVAVFVDSGFGARSDSDVYSNCVRFGEVIPSENGRMTAIGWMPSKGMPGRKKWKDTETGLLIPYYVARVDPFTGTADAGQVEMNLIEFSADFFKDVLQSLREGKAGSKWSVTEDAATEDYWKHMDAEVRTAVFNKNFGTTKHSWMPRSKHWPNHLFDCEVLQVVGAAFFGLLKLE